MPKEITNLDAIPEGPINLRLNIRMDVFETQVDYPMIVQMWDKKDAGRVKRAWLETFNEAERKTIAGYYPRFYDWYLRSGPPEKVALEIKTLLLLQRATNFFGTV